MARKRTDRQSTARSDARAGGSKVDLEAIGLVLLAFGASFGGLLLPQLPTGALGQVVQEAVTGRIGVGAYALPPPFLVLGAAFLLRRNPPTWPRVTFGYLVTVAGVWGLVMLVAPATAGAWGAALREGLTGASGWFAYPPVLLIVTLGVEAVAGWRPTRIARTAAVALVAGLRRAARAAWRARRRARARASFRADVAEVRRELRALEGDVEALAKHYPGSAEVARWRERLAEARKQLRGVDAEGLEAAAADARAWRETVGAFTRDRAAELAHQVHAEGLEAFEPWVRHRKADLADPFPAAGAAARALDGMRQALDLELTALSDRYRSCTRERDAAEAALPTLGPRSLVEALEGHATRSARLRDVAAAAARVEADTARLQAWREVMARYARLAAEFAGYGELQEYDDALAEDLEARGREVLAQRDGWAEALDAVELRARQDAQRREREAREAQEAREAEARDVAARPADPGPPAGAEPAPAAHADPVAADEARLLDADDLVHATAPAPPTPEPGSNGAEAAPGPVADPARGAPPAGEGGGPPEVGGIPIQVPSLDLFEDVSGPGGDAEEQAREVQARVRRIDETLANFNLRGRVVSSVRGPTVTRFEVEPAPGEKISRFANLSDDLALAMAASSVRIEAPIPGKSVIGLEVPNSDRDLIRFREAAEAPPFKRARARLPLILGKSIDGELVVGDLAKMPHLLIAGSTGSGKSVAVNTLIGSLLFKFLPTELRMLMIDPKMVELTPYDGIPHLIRPVVTNPNDAAGVLLGAVEHMERRYKMMSRIGAKNLDQYNEKARNLDLPHLPFLTIIIDELADLMITSPKEVESAIMRLAQMARATGMHLVLATQRPSVDILTSLIKVNVPARVAFAVSSGHDSRTILDTMGAERLVGLGDMLFYQPGMTKPTRLQGPYVGEDEIGTLASFLRRQYFDDEFVEAYGDDFEPVSADDSEASGMIDWNDDKLRQAAEMVVRDGQASVSRLQRRMQVGHARAGKLMDSLEALGVVGAHTGSKPREVLVALEELPEVFGR